ncbi:MAG: hypothetical protein J7J54_06455 [Candidatus Omnitrophica bacterium]|nr:hypothetical protein [Candidatus Omnitrophota bacterium]
MAAILTLVPNLLRIRVESSSNTYYLEFYDSDAADWKSIQQYSMETQKSDIDYVISKDTPAVILEDTASGGVERRLASKGGSAKILDENENTIIDLEAIKKHFVKTASPTPGTGGSYGAAVELTPSTNLSILPLQIKTTTGGTYATGETVTIRITVTFSDGTTASVTKSHTATGDIWLSGSEIASLMADGVYITKISIDSTSDQASTSVTTEATIYAIEI